MRIKFMTYGLLAPDYAGLPGWTDEGRRSSGVTDDVITARMREHKEDSRGETFAKLYRVGKRLQGAS